MQASSTDINNRKLKKESDRERKKLQEIYDQLRALKKKAEMQ